MEGGGFDKAGSPEDHQAGTRRPQESHECSFCNRGFTNAQALGGHTNLHRKDRAGGSGKSSTRGRAAPLTPQHDGGAGGSRQYGGGDQVHLGLALGRSEGVDLELRLGHYPCN